MSNFLMKAIFNIFYNRLLTFIDPLSSKQQERFIMGRCIQSKIGLTLELVNKLPKKRYGVNISVKINIMDANKTMDWDFL